MKNSFDKDKHDTKRFDPIMLRKKILDLDDLDYLKAKIDGLPIPKGRLVKDPYKPICKGCAIYFSITVFLRCKMSFFHFFG